MPSRVRDTTQGIGIGIEIERRPRNTGLLLEPLLLDPPSLPAPPIQAFQLPLHLPGPPFQVIAETRPSQGILIIHSQDS